MLKKIRINKKIIIIVAIVVALFVVFNLGKSMFLYHVNIRGQHLNSYSYNVGGGMNGGYHSKKVKRYGDRALITVEAADWHFQDPKVEEYLTDAAVIDELEAVVRKYRMNFWNGKKFTNEFVYDGESESYRFRFDDEDIFFSSQIYPLRYRIKLTKLDKIVKKYIEAGEKLPGLVLARPNDEMEESLPEGELVIYVYSYTENTIGVRIFNETDEVVEIPRNYKIINVDTGEILYDEESSYGDKYYEHSRNEMHIKLEKRLEEGNYKMIYGDMELPFEIR